MKVVALQMLVLLSLTAVSAVLTWKFHPEAPALYLNAEPLGDGEISVEKVGELVAGGGVLWIDARADEKFSESHMPDAILLNWTNFDFLMMDAYPSIVNQDRPVVVYCGSHSCKASKKVADKMREMMVPDVFVLKGGWDALVKAGLAP